MLALLIWGFALYGMFVALWKLVKYWIQKNRRSVPVTAVLIVSEGASYIEGILRTLLTTEPFVGRELRIVVIDCGSKDDTARIVEAIASKRYAVKLVQVEGDPYFRLTALLKQQGRGVPVLFDLRDKVAPQEVVPTLAAFWSHEAS